ncbi:MAG: energy transducer TonB [Longimicrobiaceae bacterium]
MLVLPAILALAACAAAPPASSPPAADGARASRPAPPLALNEVDEAPLLLNAAEIPALVRRHYPTLLRDAGVHGRVTVRFVVGLDGRPEGASIQVLDTTQELFGTAAESVVRRLRYTPARVAGAPVRAWMTVPVEFNLR